MITALEYLALVSLLIFALAIIGWPVNRGLEHLANRRLPVTAPLTGMCVFQIGAWYWLISGGNGLLVPTATLLVAGAVGSGVWLVQRQRRIDRPRLAFSLGALVLIGAVLALNFSSLFHLSFVTTADLGNNDAPNYALVGNHLATSGFSDPGSIVDYDVGDQARTDGFGSTALIGGYSAVTGIAAWKLTTVVLLALAVLASYHLALLVRELVPRHPAFAVAIGGIAAMSFIFTYIASQSFLGQVMAMGCLPIVAVAGLRAATEKSTHTLVLLVVAMAIPLLVILSHYAFMAFLGPPVLLPALILADDAPTLTWATVRRRTLRLLGVFAGAGLLAAVIVPQWLWVAYFRGEAVGDIDIPWRLGGFLPADLLGLGDRLVTVPSGRRIVLSVATLAVFAAACVILRRRQPMVARFTATLAVLILVSYFLVYRSEGGPTYRQWKWISFFQPMFAAVVLAAVVLACVEVLPRIHLVRLAAGLAVLALVAAVVTSETGRSRDGLHPLVAGTLQGDEPPAYATIDQRELSTDPTLRKLDEINVDLDFWDSMWAGYFLPNRTIRVVSPAYYYRATKGTAAWTLVPNDPKVGGDMYEPINASFRLLRTPKGPTSDHADGLGAMLTTTAQTTPVQIASEGGTVGLTIRNSGSATWVVNGPIGTVQVGVRLHDANGALLDPDWLHASMGLEPRVSVPAGATVRTTLSLRPLPPGEYLADVQMVSEGVAWFGPTIRLPLESR